MRIPKKQEERIRELYMQDKGDGVRSFEEFHKQYSGVSKIDFLSYWRICPYLCKKLNNESLASTVANPPKRINYKKFRLCPNPDFLH